MGESFLPGCPDSSQNASGEHLLRAEAEGGMHLEFVVQSCCHIFIICPKHSKVINSQPTTGMTDLSGYFLGSGFNASTGEVPFPQFLGFGGTIGL